MGEIAKISYAQTKQSVIVDELGMRQMQRRVYERRDSQYLLLKAPPASGKSRAFMFIALDKLYKQGLDKVIIAVPEMSIGGSFKKTNLMVNGFFSNWEPSDQYNLCTPGSDINQGKVDAFIRYVKQEKKERILICTHATLRFAYDKLTDSDFDGVFLGIDEFHHASANTDDNRLGDLVKGITEKSSAHIMALTGSYFRGDGIAVLEPDVENKFDSVTYSYYDQLSGYKHLHSITLSYEFYSGVYYESLEKSLHLDRKTIIHIPNVNSQESTGNKYEEVNHIIDIIGTIDHEDATTGVLYVKAKNDRMMKIIDLVDDRYPEERVKRQIYLKEHSEDKDAVDIIIALNMAREGFDWPPCEQMLTIGYRGSLTEVVQIIGRATRDYEGKSDAYFTNIIVEPDATRGEVITAVNNLLKAITASLLMEQVLAPKWDFKAKAPKLIILAPESEEGKQIISNENAYEDLLESIRTNEDVIKANLHKSNAQLINKYLIPSIIMDKHPELTVNDIEAIRQHVVTDLVLGSAKSSDDNKEKNDNDSQDNNSGQDLGREDSDDGTTNKGTGTKFLKFANGIVLDIKELDINLIDKINPFEKAYQILSKDIDKPTLRAIKDAIDKKKGRMKLYTDKECLLYWPNIKIFVEVHHRNPDRHSEDEYEAVLGAVLYTIKMKQEARKNEG